MNKKMPKGGSKGGIRFPRTNLKQAISFAKKLVSKTHTGAQPARIILPGVFNNAGPEGQVRASALKQFDLLKGDSKAYEATELAKKISVAPQEEATELLKKACLNPKLFKQLYDTFHSDTATIAKIKQQAAHLKVHPDSLDVCCNVFVDSLLYAGLATKNGEDVKFENITVLTDIQTVDQEEGKEGKDTEGDDLVQGPKNPTDGIGNKNQGNTQGRINKGTSQIEIKIDPSMDPEKLDKLLNVLRKYNQI